MSNWNGEGVPDNGQRLAHELGGAINKFIGVNSAGDWVAEDEGNFPRVYAPYLLRPIKTPEQVEEEKAIDDLTMLLPDLFDNHDCTDYELAKALYDAGYHNQPKVKPLNFDDYCNDPEFPGLSYDQRMTLKALIQDGYIIEVKEKGQ